MKRRLKGDSTITSAKKMVEATKNMCNKDIDVKYLKNLAESMPKRILYIIEHM